MRAKPGPLIRGRKVSYPFSQFTTTLDILSSSIFEEDSQWFKCPELTFVLYSLMPMLVQNFELVDRELDKDGAAYVATQVISGRFRGCGQEDVSGCDGICRFATRIWNNAEWVELWGKFRDQLKENHNLWDKDEENTGKDFFHLMTNEHI